jgi:hypothetical protein
MVMTYTAIEILAILLIVLAAIKLVVILVDARVWLGFAKRVYAKPAVTSSVALLLAGLVLHLLLNSVALLLMVSVAPYAGRLFAWLETQSLPAMLRQQWLYIVVWVLLLAWGAIEIFAG